MTSHSNDSLQEYVDELFRLRDEQGDAGIASIDALALTCLRIAMCLLDDSLLGNLIAKELALIGELPEQRSSTEEDLLAGLKSVDDDLEASLKGFSGLMEWILEDTHVRKDPSVSLQLINNVDPIIANDFGRLVRALEAHKDLDEAFSLSSQTALAAIFVMVLSDLLCDLLAIEAHEAEELLATWLDERVKNDDLQSLYHDAQHLVGEPLLHDGSARLTKDVIVVLLCLWSADWQVLNQEQAQCVDKALCSIGMLGIKPFIEAGFLEVEERVKEEMVGSNPHLFITTLKA